MGITILVSFGFTLLTVIAISCGMTVYELHCIRRNKSVRQAERISKDMFV